MSASQDMLSKKNVVILVIAGIAIYLLCQIKDIALLFYASFVVASALNPIVDYLNRRMSRGLAISLLYLVGMILLILFFVPLAGILVDQTINLLEQLPSYWEQLTQQADNFKIISTNYGINIDPSEIVAATTAFGQDLLARWINITIDLLGGLVITFTLGMIVLYMLLDKEYLRSGFISFFPKESREKAESISSAISKKVGGYIVGQSILLIVTGLFSALGLFLFDIKFALVLGLIAGLLDIIPIVGPIIATGLAMIVAFSQDPILALAVLGVYTFVQWAINTFLRPYILGKFLDLHPLIIIFALLVSASFLGVTGVILSPAIAATVSVIIEELYLKRINQEKYVGKYAAFEAQLER